jgi:hypothetical protein
MKLKRGIVAAACLLVSLAGCGGFVMASLSNGFFQGQKVIL